MVGNFSEFVHALLLVLIRGLNLSLIIHMFIAKQGWNAFNKMANDIHHF